MNEDSYDAFIKNSMYPNAVSIFSNHLKSIDEIKDKCIFVLDTNALLLPFLTGSQSLNEIKKVYSKIKEQNRLIIPGQVAREFANNRPEKLKDIYQQLTRKRSAVQDLDTGKYPLLQGIEDYKKVIVLEKSINDQLVQYRKLITSINENVKGWLWDDPVSLMYREIFSEGTILDITLDKEKIKSNLKHRYLHKIPPGYKDGGKPDDGIGDLLIWMTILEIGQQKKDVVFISGDEKSDWFHTSEKYALYPRFELINEFSLASDGKSFHIIRLSSLLGLFGADEKVVKEVATEEIPVRNKFSISFLVGKWLNEWDINGLHPGSEQLEIKEDGSYIRNNEHIFNVENFTYDSQTNQISFVKASARPPTIDNRRVKNTLNVVSNDMLSGKEDDYDIRYTRVK